MKRGKKKEWRKQAEGLLQFDLRFTSDKGANSSLQFVHLPEHFPLFLKFLIPRVVYDNIHISCPCTFLKKKKKTQVIKPSLAALVMYKTLYKWEVEDLLASMLSKAFVTPWRASKKSSLYISYSVKEYITILGEKRSEKDWQQTFKIVSWMAHYKSKWKEKHISVANVVKDTFCFWPNSVLVSCNIDLRIHNLHCSCCNFWLHLLQQ